jgi:hypothetical protein
MKSYYHCTDEDKVKELFIGQSVKKVSEDRLLLSNGVELHIEPNDGCSCGSGCYGLTELNECENVITNVELHVDEIDETACSYQLFVLAEDKRLKLVQVDGDDGNGYYGSGYYINVKLPKEDIN